MVVLVEEFVTNLSSQGGRCGGSRRRIRDNFVFKGWSVWCIRLKATGSLIVVVIHYVLYVHTLWWFLAFHIWCGRATSVSAASVMKNAITIATIGHLQSRMRGTVSSQVRSLAIFVILFGHVDRISIIN